LIASQLGRYRDGRDFAGGQLGNGQITCAVAEPAACRLEVDWHRKMNSGANFAFRERLLPTPMQNGAAQ